MQETTVRRRRPALYMLGAVAGLVALLAVIGISVYVRYERGFRPRLLAAAGPIELGALATDVSPDTVMAPATGAGNAAAYYVAALNAYGTRRLPYLERRKLDPMVQEPPLSTAEAALLIEGSQQRDCDLYLRGHDGAPRYAYLPTPRKEPWPFVVASDPFALRPYVEVARLLAQAGLNRGKALEGQRRWAEAGRLYQAIARMGWHLRQNPGSMLDVSLALEVERRALHYLDAYCRLTRSRAYLARCWRYGDSLSRLDVAIRRKFSQLGNAEAAMLVLQRDSQRVWRLEAAFALATVVHLRPLGWLESRTAEAALQRGLRDPDPGVRSAIRTLLQMRNSEYRSEELKQKEDPGT